MTMLSRIVSRSHPKMGAGSGDTVLFASSLIPESENPIYRLANNLIKFRAKVVHQGNARVHIFGHATASELLYHYNVLESTYAMPIHDGMRHQVANGGTTVKTGVPPQDVILAENDSVIDVRDAEVSVTGQMPCHSIYVNGLPIGDITEEELKDRRTLAEKDFVVISAAVETKEKEVVMGSHIRARTIAEDDLVFDGTLPDVADVLRESLENEADTYQIQQAIRRIADRWIPRKPRRAPIIIPAVVEVRAGGRTRSKLGRPAGVSG